MRGKKQSDYLGGGGGKHYEAAAETKSWRVSAKTAAARLDCVLTATRRNRQKVNRQIGTKQKQAESKQTNWYETETMGWEKAFRQKQQHGLPKSFALL